MSRKAGEATNAQVGASPLPSTIHFNNMTNQVQLPDVATLRTRIEELESKVGQLQSKIRNKKKRIRRKSCEVQKKYSCDVCKRSYGSLVSLNLHLRIKHKKGEKKKQQAVEKEPKPAEEAKLH